MTDRPPDAGRDPGPPLFPRRTLEAQRSERPGSDPGPDPGSDPDPDSGPDGARSAEQRPRQGWAEPARDPGSDGGPPTAALPRVDESTRQPAAGSRTAAPTTSPAEQPGQGRDGASPSTPPVRPASGPQATAAARAATSTTVPATAAAAPGTPTPTASAPAPAKKPKTTRKARLRMVRLDPWSVMKMAFALSIALAVVLVIAVAIVWSVLDAAGVWTAINESAATLLDAQAGETEFDVEEFVGFERVLGITIVVAVADVVLLTALATLAAFMYNLAAALLGGMEVTLAEDR